MALIKCRECGKEVSTEAKACPSCGAPPPPPPRPKTSTETWIIAGLFALVGFAYVMSTINQRNSSVTASSAKPSDPPPKSHWTVIKESVDPNDKKIVMEIERMKWHDVCYAWGEYLRSRGPGTRRGDALRGYLRHAQLINDIDSANADKSRIEVGMTACGTYAAFGKPDAVNTTTTANTTREQIVYRSHRLYVYTESSAGNHNGVVRSFQN